MNNKSRERNRLIARLVTVSSLFCFQGSNCFKAGILHHFSKTSSDSGRNVPTLSVLRSTQQKQRKKMFSHLQVHFFTKLSLEEGLPLLVWLRRLLCKTEKKNQTNFILSLNFYLIFSNLLNTPGIFHYHAMANK